MKIIPKPLTCLALFLTTAALLQGCGNKTEQVENGYRYYINSEEVSQEEYKNKLSDLIGNNSMDSGQFISGHTIREAYAKFKAIKGM